MQASERGLTPRSTLDLASPASAVGFGSNAWPRIHIEASEMPPAPVHCRVRLKSFKGALSGPPDGNPEEDYWRLIGMEAEVVEASDERGRVLVRFAEPVAALGLHCHNLEPNALFIHESDLEIIE